MSTLAEIFDISISTTAETLSLASFGKPIIMACDVPAAFTDRVREYGSGTEMLSDGWTVEHEAYKMAVVLKSQNPCPDKFLVGRRANKRSQSVALTVSAAAAVEGAVVKLTVGGYELSRTVPASSSTTAEATAWASLIDARPLVTATSASAKVTVATTAAGGLTKFSGFSHSHFSFEDETSDPGLEADLVACLAEDPSFYYVLYDAVGKAEWLGAADWCEANRRMQSHAFTDSNILDSSNTTTNVWSASASYSYAYSSPGFDKANGTHLAAGRAGKCLPYSPGEETWSLKTIAAVAASEYLTGERSAMRAKRGWFYTTIGGVGNTMSGRLGDTSFGEWTDVVRFMDWLRQDMQVSFYSAVKSFGPKMPFTAKGIDGIETAIRASINRGIDVGGIASDPAPTFVFPKASSFTSSQRQARAYEGIKWGAYIAGAIHEGEATGTLTA
jgi:hypothetical protein